MSHPRQLSGVVRRLLDGVNLPIVIVHPVTLTATYVNPAFEEMAGRPREQIADVEIAKLFSRESRKRVEALCEVAAKSPDHGLEEYECELIRRSGRPIPVNARASTVMLGTRHWLILSVHDLTVVRRLQNQREMNLKEMSQVSKLADIGLLAAGVAHELNNPLMIVQGFAENLDMLLDQPDLKRDELKAQTAEILRATDRMGRIIGQMSRMVRTTEIKFDVVDLQEVAQNVLRFLGHEIKFSNTEIVIDSTAENLVKCDHNQIEQVIMNIVSNALHALEARPEGRQIRISALNHQGWTELKIWNNGPAIPPEIQDKIMTPFFTTKEVGKGTGLGLTVSFGIMKAHGGSLTFASNEQTGTEFCLRFPAPEIESVRKRTESPGSIVLVDDDPAALDVLANKVLQFGYAVIRVRGGHEAFHLITHDPSIVAVFTDLRMPDMDGLALCRHIRQVLNPGPAIFIVTGYGSSPNLDRDLKAAGINGLLQKPINHNAFSAVMHQIGLIKKPA